MANNFQTTQSALQTPQQQFQTPSSTRMKPPTSTTLKRSSKKSFDPKRMFPFGSLNLEVDMDIKPVKAICQLGRCDDFKTKNCDVIIEENERSSSEKCTSQCRSDDKENLNNSFIVSPDTDLSGFHKLKLEGTNASKTTSPKKPLTNIDNINAVVAGMEKSQRNVPQPCQRQIVVNGKCYVICKKLGEGGSCEVFEVVESHLQQIRALKCISLNCSSFMVQTYINEVNTLSRLQKSDYVVKMFDWGRSNDKLYVVLERGEIDLATLLRNYNSQKLPATLIVHYWHEMLMAVKHIHEKGIIHSDLKPANFLLVTGRLKLIDFGISSTVSDDMTSIFKSGQAGTMNYISPEALSDVDDGSQTSKFKISYKSDVWSLGCILYKLVYGYTPFEHIQNKYEKMCAIINPQHRIAYPMTDYPSVILKVLKCCLQHDARKRPSVVELLSVQYIGCGQCRQ